MIGAIKQRRLEIGDRKSGNESSIARCFQALLDSGYERLRDRPAKDVVLELEA